MIKLLVQEYLRSGKTLEDLKVEHGVYSYVHNGKVSLTYDMIEAKESDPLSQQCRGLILKEETYDVIAAPLFRFFNMEQESIAAKIDWSSASFLEKLDGSLLIGYFFEGRWYVATRSRPEADGTMDGGDLTFANLVDQTVAHMFKKTNPIILFDHVPNLQDLMNLWPEEARNYTFCFELTSPFNRIVCRYDEPWLTLLAIRDNRSLLELVPEPWVRPKWGVNVPKAYAFDNVSHMVEVIRSWNPEEHEGVVVKDKFFNRIKVKNPSYIAINHMRDSLSTSWRGCAEIILLGKDDDVIKMLPEFIVNRITRLKNIIHDVLIQTEKDYNEIKHIENMKEYALIAQQKAWPAALFALKRGKSSDLKSFIFGKGTPNGGISTSSLDSVLNLCVKLDPTLKDTI